MTTPQRRSFTPKYANFFYGHCFYCTNFGHKIADCGDYKRNIQEEMPMWPHVTLNVINVITMDTQLVIVEA